LCEKNIQTETDRQTDTHAKTEGRREKERERERDVGTVIMSLRSVGVVNKNGTRAQ